MESVRQHYRIDPRQIGFLRFLLEGYDGMASLTTLDPQTGQIVLQIAPGREPEVDRLLQELRREFLIEAGEPGAAAF
jgi:hypothetical protein